MREVAAPLAPISRRAILWASVASLWVGLAAAPAEGAPQAGGARTAESSAGASAYDQRPEVIDFVDAMVRDHGFERGELLAQFAHAHFNASVARLVTPSSSGALPIAWSDYRAQFLDPGRIEAGTHFWLEHRDDLARAQQVYGVPAEIIVGILGVETFYGRNTGKFRLIDALSTLAFDYPNKAHDRSAFFKGELEQFLLLARSNHLDVTSFKGSYAGAIGLPQFMPDSYQHYAVDFDGDGTIDLQNDTADAIGSVANFLAEHGWQRSGALFYRVQMVQSHPDDAAVARLVGAGVLPSLTTADIESAGFVVIDAVARDELLTLVDLPDGSNGARYVLGPRNFYVLTRYNRSYPYAMAVIELGETIKANLPTP